MILKYYINHSDFVLWARTFSSLYPGSVNFYDICMYLHYKYRTSIGDRAQTT